MNKFKQKLEDAKAGLNIITTGDAWKGLLYPSEADILEKRKQMEKDKLFYLKNLLFIYLEITGGQIRDVDAEIADVLKVFHDTYIDRVLVVQDITDILEDCESIRDIKLALMSEGGYFDSLVSKEKMDVIRKAIKEVDPE